MRRVAWLLAVPAAALAGVLFGLAPVADMGLPVPSEIVGPLALVSNGPYSGLAAAAAGTLPLARR